jgi:hypothetical protein
VVDFHISLLWIRWKWDSEVRLLTAICSRQKPNLRVSPSDRRYGYRCFIGLSTRAVGRGRATCAAAQGAIERGGRQNGWSETNIISQGQNVPPWASEGALFEHVAQGTKMPSYGPAIYTRVNRVRLTFDKRCSSWDKRWTGMVVVYNASAVWKLLSWHNAQQLTTINRVAQLTKLSEASMTAGV